MKNIKGRVQYNYLGERYFGNDYANTQKQMEDYQTVDLYLGFEFKKGEFFINAANIFGEKYSDYAYYYYDYSSMSDAYGYYPMPEESYRAGVKFSF